MASRSLTAAFCNRVRLPPASLSSTSALSAKEALLLPLSSCRGFASLAFSSMDASDPEKKEKEEVDLADLSFDNPKQAFSKMGSAELFRHAAMLSSLRIPGLASHANQMVHLSQKILGKSITMSVIRHTYFRHFCGGEDLNGLIATSKNLSRKGIGAIVDYAAESEDDLGGDAWFEANVGLTKNAIACAAEMKQPGSFSYVAVKVTAVSSPVLLRKLSSVLNLSHHLFGVAAGVHKFSAGDCFGVHEDHDELVDSFLNERDFKKALKSVWPDMSDKSVSEMFKSAASLKGALQPNSVSYYQWQSFFSPSKLASLPAPVIPSAKNAPEWLSASDLTDIRNATQRMHQIAEYAKEPSREIRLLIDAEQTFFQPAIDFFALEQQALWNSGSDLKTTPAIIYNTYQMYLKSALGRLEIDAKRADMLGYKFATKLVRGAYMFQERAVAAELGCSSPVHDCIENTHISYDTGVELMIERVANSELLCGTHNEHSTKKAAAELSRRDLDPKNTPVAFAQLLGMCDHISLVLGQAGCHIYKYVPYGPVDVVVPYLVRRAEENSSLLGSSVKETSMMWFELRQRMLKKIGLVA